MLFLVRKRLEPRRWFSRPRALGWVSVTVRPVGRSGGAACGDETAMLLTAMLLAVILSSRRATAQRELSFFFLKGLGCIASCT